MAESVQSYISKVTDTRVQNALNQIAKRLLPRPLVIAGGSALAVTESMAGSIINLDTLAGTTATLPAATGSGNKYRFRVSVLATSNSHIVKVNNTTDAMEGILVMSDAAVNNAVAFRAVAGTSDTITLNRTTTGSVLVGEYFEVEDILSGRYRVSGVIASSGTSATPFSATV